ncbi:amidohydrolase [Gallibacterium salpingitidis]|uniref:amidohydrolase n=1 Tax=Gallibacterium salpingitidis TaxID=505341 RepID=UPI000824BFCC|nr:amidohydrolase [Gallibacterium salpingitidis]
MTNYFSRRQFISTTALTAAAISLPTLAQQNNAFSKKTYSKTHNEYLLNNILLETNFVYHDNKVVATQTKNAALYIKDGIIKAILKKGENPNNLPIIDGEGLLAIPALQDLHIHLDKSWYGLPWRTISRKGWTIQDMIAYEQKILPELLETSIKRTGEMISLLNQKGTVIARSHCNIEPTSQLKSLKHLEEALDQNKNNLECEIVAFPQHGLLRSNSEKLMREAMKMGAHYVGGLDPTKVDGDMKKSLDTMFAIALDNGKGVDIHLHEPNPSGGEAIKYMIDYVAKEKDLHGKLTLSHAFAFMNMQNDEVKQLAEKMAEYGISLASTLPFGNAMMPLPIFQTAGVKLMSGTDSILDWWSPLGSGDMLEKARLWAQLYRQTDELGLSRSLSIATAGITPLNEKGDMVWPKVGDKATFTLVAASCSAEAVARLPEQRRGFLNGKPVIS